MARTASLLSSLRPAQTILPLARLPVELWDVVTDPVYDCLSKISLRLPVA